MSYVGIAVIRQELMRRASYLDQSKISLMDNNKEKSATRDDVLKRYLRDICIRYGFCLAPLVGQSLIDNPGDSASMFVKKIIFAEGLGKDGIIEHFDALHACLNADVLEFFNSA